MSARVIRVDWSAFAAANAQSRRACGAKAFVLGSTHVHLPPPPADDFDRAAARKAPEPTRRRPRVTMREKDDGRLPGMGAWLERNVGKRGLTC